MFDMEKSIIITNTKWMMFGHTSKDFFNNEKKIVIKII